ncbi:amidohydrolase [Kribbella sp. NPDC048928]|uniref:amidohydrolase n=1 Tax=Kribbella sp. NPDC048928 TaxID=3364111 RepID=UPI0037116E12
MSRLLIRNVSVLVVPEQGECRVDEAQDIHIQDDRIVAITWTSSPSASASASPSAFRAPSSAPVPGTGFVYEGSEVVDGRGLLAVPGLVNAHTHSPMVMMRGAAEDLAIEDWFNQRIWPMEVNLTPERVRVGARLACAEMLLGGVTTFVDHYFHADQIAAAAIESGIRADLAPTFFSTSTSSTSSSTSSTSSATSASAEAFEVARGLRGLHPRVTASLGPHATYTVSEGDLLRTAEVARAEGFRIHLHAAETDEQTRASLEKSGVTPIGVLERTGVLDAGVLVAHGCGIRPEDLPILERYAGRTAVASCPKVYLKLAMGEVTPVKGLVSAGVSVGVGTDGAAVHNTLDVWEAIRMVALTQKQRENDAEWMTLSDTLRLATRGSAAAAGLTGRVGVLEPGYQADIALVDLSAPHNQPLHDPRAALVYSVRAADVVTVLVAGQVVVRDRQLTTMDLQEVLADARSLAHTLVDLSSGGAIQHYEP